MGEELGLINILYGPQELKMTTYGKTDGCIKCKSINKLKNSQLGQRVQNMCVQMPLFRHKYQYVLILIGILQLEVSCRHEHSFDGPHAVIVMELGGELL